ncbi:hypothetical protein GUJ93_ZPchr0006g40677 [Zizania palustris]|uniref:Uncharacterized protein n=1 Tax=Zizania palustris TaxID=103762 RepID=A0A8J5VSC7_ZIZPA|nr:hypothetical protein GUJ93_ZPchr0006g40677 [Zizania palustris]
MLGCSRNVLLTAKDSRNVQSRSDCCAGLVNEGISIFNSMEIASRVIPDIKHYGCMVCLFSRAGLIALAYRFINSMAFEPDLAILGASLSACNINNELEYWILGS